jgi:putative PIN family toxin of toxin-antitoxin system
VGAIEVIPVVLDTAVFVSALLFEGTPGKLITLWKSGKILPHLTSEIVAELPRVLAYPRFVLAENEIQYLLDVEIMPFCRVIAANSGSVIIRENLSDDMFLFPFPRKENFLTTLKLCLCGSQQAQSAMMQGPWEHRYEGCGAYSPALTADQ